MREGGAERPVDLLLGPNTPLDGPMLVGARGKTEEELATVGRSPRKGRRLEPQ